MRPEFVQARHRGLLSIVLILTVLLVGMVVLVPAAATPDRPTSTVATRSAAFDAWYANGSDALQKAVNEQRWYEHAALDHFYAVVVWNDAVARNQAAQAAAQRAAQQRAASRPRSSTPAPASNYSGGSGGWYACIRAHESGGNYATNTGNGYYGAYQFSQSTWDATAERHSGDQLPTPNADGSPRYASVLVGERPSSASSADQDQMAAWLRADSGPSQWSTSRDC